MMMNLSFVLLCMFICLFDIPICSSLGKFSIELERLINRQGLNVNGSCCTGPDHFFTCLQPCKTFLRFCLRNVNPNLDNINRIPSVFDSQECTYGFDETPILGGNNIDFTLAPQRANVIELPFKFSWMGEFVLQIDVFNDKTYDGVPYPGSARELIMSSVIRSSISVNSPWQESLTVDSVDRQLSFRYRVSCASHFFGAQCARFCAPLSSRASCDPLTGDIRCQQGWTGSDCNKALCREGCRNGDCEQSPGECHCLQGWNGDRCDRAVKRCESRPCHNEGRCIDLPSENYRCECPPSFTGIHCESGVCPSCLNGGRCLGSRCQCPPGFQGSLCEEPICLNGGIVSPLSSCLCPSGFEGDRCQLSSSCPPCRNNGRCVNNSCVCSKEFIGQYCEIDVRLLQKSARSSSFSVFELLIPLSLLSILIPGIMFVSCLFYRYHKRQIELQRVNQIDLEKVWTISEPSRNVFHDDPMKKLVEKKDVNVTLQQTAVRVEASLV